MSRIKKAKELADLIIEYGNGDISKDRAELIAFHYYLNKKWTLFDHTSLTQLANNLALAEKGGAFQYSTEEINPL